MRILLIGLALLATTAVAHAAQTRYIGIHPVAKSSGGGICYIEGPHVHVYEADAIQYRDHHGHKHFVGDPVAYGYDGPKHAYKGHHPIQVNVVLHEPEPAVEYCYLDGPHFHYFAAIEGPEWKRVDNTWFFVGAPPQVYLDARPTFIGINAVYQPFVYDRPIVTVDPPAGWIGLRVVAPSVEIHTPVPAVRVRGGGAAVVGGGVGIGVGVHVGVRVPPPPSVRVNIGVGIGVGGGVKVKGGGRAKVKRRF
jgi:hypothetical protein